MYNHFLYFVFIIWIQNIVFGVALIFFSLTINIFYLYKIVCVVTAM